MNIHKNQKGAIKINDVVIVWFRIREGVTSKFQDDPEKIGTVGYRRL